MRGHCTRIIGFAEEILRQTLPAYMVPEVIIPLEELPLTRNGKVDPTPRDPASQLLLRFLAFHQIDGPMFRRLFSSTMSEVLSHTW